MRTISLFLFHFPLHVSIFLSNFFPTCFFSLLVFFLFFYFFFFVCILFFFSFFLFFFCFAREKIYYRRCVASKRDWCNTIEAMMFELWSVEFDQGHIEERMGVGEEGRVRGRLAGSAHKTRKSSVFDQYTVNDRTAKEEEGDQLLTVEKSTSTARRSQLWGNCDTPPMNTQDYIYSLSCWYFCYLLRVAGTLVACWCFGRLRWDKWVWILYGW